MVDWTPQVKKLDKIFDKAVYLHVQLVVGSSLTNLLLICCQVSQKKNSNVSIWIPFLTTTRAITHCTSSFYYPLNYSQRKECLMTVAEEEIQDNKLLQYW